MEKYFFEAFENMERLGPGDESSTLNAVKCIDTTRKVKILDVGCGVGTHSFLIANAFENVEITAIDNSQDFIDKLNSRADELNLSTRVVGVCMSMFEMTFEDCSFDYIFAEGSIYIAGFTNGLADWKRLLKPKGMLICSELSWITAVPSAKPQMYWNTNYPQIADIDTKVNQAKESGYNLVEYFTLPKHAWTDNYYVPLQHNLDKMKCRYDTNEEALEVVAIIQDEIDLYTQFGTEYSYVFYLLQLN